MSGTVSLQRESSEKLELPIGTTDDPSSFTVDFATTDRTNTEERPSTWSAGTWKSAASGGAGSYTRTAVTPVLSLAVGSYTLWVRVTTGSETAVDKAGTVKVK